jgi:hypothetical protein
VIPASHGPEQSLCLLVGQSCQNPLRNFSEHSPLTPSQKFTAGLSLHSEKSIFKRVVKLISQLATFLLHIEKIKTKKRLTVLKTM